MIIARYFAREVYTTVAVVTSVLLLIFLSNQFVRYLGMAAAGKISGLIVLKIIALQIPYILGLLLPAGLFLSILLAYGRMYVDNEMTVLKACGMSTARLITITLKYSLVIMLIVATMSLYISPQLKNYQAHLQTVSQADTLIQTLVPGRFHVAGNGKQVYYIEKISRNQHKAKNIFVAVQKDRKNKQGQIQPPIWNIVSAQSGYEANYNEQGEPIEEGGDSFIVAVNGHRYSGVPGEKNFQLVKFGKYGMRLDESKGQVKIQSEAMDNKTLWQNRYVDKHAIAELQWRLSMPLSVPVLAFLAVPLSQVPPRKGRYARLLPSILIYSIYANLLFVAKDWLVHGKISPYIGVWWLHASLFTLAVFLLIDRRLLYRRCMSFLKTIFFISRPKHAT